MNVLILRKSGKYRRNTIYSDSLRYIVRTELRKRRDDYVQCSHDDVIDNKSFDDSIECKRLSLHKNLT